MPATPRLPPAGRAIEPRVAAVAEACARTPIAIAEHLVGAVVLSVEGPNHARAVLSGVGALESHWLVKSENVPWIDAVPLRVARLTIVPGETLFARGERDL